MNLSSASTSANVCGVFLSIFNTGVLLKGKSGIGKSDLALSLLERGHKLIADDVVEFRVIDHTLQGSSPALLQNHLHIRDLGVLDITALFGPLAVMAEQTLALIVELQQDFSPACEIAPDQDDFLLCGVKVPYFHLFALPTRPLALLLETLVKQYNMALTDKRSVSQVFIQQQHQFLGIS